MQANKAGKNASQSLLVRAGKNGDRHRRRSQSPFFRTEPVLVLPQSGNSNCCGVCGGKETDREEHLAVAIGPWVEERVQAPRTEPVPVLPHVSSTSQECCLVQKPDGLKATLPEFAGFMIFPIGPHRDLLTQHPHPLTEITQSQSVWRMARGNARSRFRLSD